MKLYKYNQLSKKSQAKAILDYKNGWKETHPKENLSTDTVHDILLNDLEDYRYSQGGVLKEIDGEPLESE